MTPAALGEEMPRTKINDTDLQRALLEKAVSAKLQFFDLYPDLSPKDAQKAHAHITLLGEVARAGFGPSPNGDGAIKPEHRERRKLAAAPRRHVPKLEYKVRSRIYAEMNQREA